MSEEPFFAAIKELESKYSLLLKGETTPEQETELKLELIDLLSTLEANASTASQENKPFITLLKDTREALLHWDPYGPWFREQKNLVDSFYEIIVNAKKVVLGKDSSEDRGEASRLKKELSALRTEITELKSFMMELLKSKTPPTSSPKSLEQPLSDSVDRPLTTEETGTILEEQKAVTRSTPPAVESKNSSDEMPLPEDLMEREDLEYELKALEKLMKTDDELVLTNLPPKTESGKKISPTSSLATITQEEIMEEIEEKSSMAATKGAVQKEEEEGEEEVEPILEAKATVKKLSQKRSGDSHPSKILDKMTTILAEAEEKTQQQILKLQEVLAQSSATTAKSEEQEELEETKPKRRELQVEGAIQESSPNELAEAPSDNSSPSQEDPYMQLLSLEAEKYRLEKAFEKLETEFQEGLINKQEFDEGIQKANERLALIKEKIELLRKDLRE
ncbi:MAG: hypothetical protein GF308_13815 [Candidatus Heimdallarchaeota archaeon]|nr:hypothetical protein [Candidatus Heimdallarchaeota archaeon]